MVTENAGVATAEEVAREAPETSIARTIVPYPRDDDKALYLGYRASGFSIREALKLVDKHKSTLSVWRRDEVFAGLEYRIPEFRKELSKEYIEIEFFRNFRLVLEKDYRVLQASLNKEILSKADHDYLLKLRSQYTPMQLQILESVVTGSGDGWNFAQFVASNPDVVELSRTDKVTVRKND